MVAIEVAEKGIFNTTNMSLWDWIRGKKPESPLDVVMNMRAFDVLKIFNLNLAK